MGPDGNDCTHGEIGAYNRATIEGVKGNDVLAFSVGSQGFHLRHMMKRVTSGVSSLAV